jgi:hypothetical protein
MPVAFHYDSLVPASSNKRMKIMLNPDEHLRWFKRDWEVFIYEFGED